MTEMEGENENCPPKEEVWEDLLTLKHMKPKHWGFREAMCAAVSYFPSRRTLVQLEG